ncbi:hypothetical protein [Arthrobacter oryzae]|uniref:Uncharacterized protein n=1 Tax=Arthrobacter oryzae TaxID=409290 RepID=A0A3N0BRD2_9MICC|nr:hypothetical protein [Arthrobacter oryzae]RNL51580.1 hypothetical protein D7003_15745 [Arthrobacter oryzae]
MQPDFTGTAAPATAPTSKATRSPARNKKRALIADSLKAEPQLSDREHARRTGTSPTTVAAVRKDLQASGAVSKLDTRIDPRGYEQPAHKRKPTKAAPILRPTTPERTMNQISVISLDEWQHARRKE